MGDQEQVGVNPNAPDSQESFVKNSFQRFLETYGPPIEPGALSLS